MKKANLVTVKLPYDKHDDSLFVCVNGKSYQIMRGVPVQIPAYVAEVIRNSEESDNAALIRRQEMAKRAAKN